MRKLLKFLVNKRIIILTLLGISLIIYWLLILKFHCGGYWWQEFLQVLFLVKSSAGGFARWDLSWNLL